MSEFSFSPSSYLNGARRSHSATPTEAEKKQSQTEQQAQLDAFKDQARIHPMEQMKQAGLAWNKDEQGQYTIQAQDHLASGILETFKFNASAVWRSLSFLIGFADNLEALRQRYKESFKASRSMNLLLAKFAALRAGRDMTLLLKLGATPDDLGKLQREALDEALAENKALFDQNEYNLALVDIFSSSRRDRRRKRTFLQVRKTLMEQVQKLTKQECYGPESILHIQAEQYQKILMPLQNDLNYKEYQIHFVLDDPKPGARRHWVSGPVETLTKSDIKKQIDKLKIYVDRILTRMTKVQQDIHKIHHIPGEKVDYEQADQTLGVTA
jgi:hypothetical protein